MSRILFIPWGPDESEEQTWKCRKWQGEGLLQKGKYYTIAHYEGKHNPHISALGNDGQIYIRGHGSVGGDSICENTKGDNDIKYNEVCDRLIKSGLKASFGGKIKFWNCHSALMYGGVEGSAPFAKHCADYLRSKGFHYAMFFGYIGALDSYYTDHWADDKIHRGVTHYEKKYEVRASVGRIAL